MAHLQETEIDVWFLTGNIGSSKDLFRSVVGDESGLIFVASPNTRAVRMGDLAFLAKVKTGKRETQRMNFRKLAREMGHFGA